MISASVPTPLDRYTLIKPAAIKLKSQLREVFSQLGNGSALVDCPLVNYWEFGVGNTEAQGQLTKIVAAVNGFRINLEFMQA